MRILLDENFPLQLHRRLVAAGRDCEHIIVLGAAWPPDRPPGHLFEILPDGELVAWEER